MFGGSAFGGDAANQFAGGGFMPSQANDTGYGGGGGSGGAKKSNQPQTLRTLTIRQLVQNVAHRDDGIYKVDDVELANLTVIGKIVRVHSSNSRLGIVITDGTGELEMTHWLQEDDEYGAQNTKAELQPGVYVKAHGHLREFNNQVAMTAFNVRPVTNFNEVTYHFLRAIFEHLHLTKGGAGAAGAQPAAGGNFGAPMGGSWGGGAPQQQQQPMGGATAFAGAGSDDPCQTAVLAIIQGCNHESGVHTQQIYNELSGRFDKGAIDNALGTLINEAHVYNTTDDCHFRAA